MELKPSLAMQQPCLWSSRGVTGSGSLFVANGHIRYRSYNVWDQLPKSHAGAANCMTWEVYQDTT